MESHQKRIARFEFKRDPDNGCLIGPEGRHYDSEAEAMYFDQIGLCGCGSARQIHAFLLRCMAMRKDKNLTLIDIESVEEEVRQNIEIVAEFVLHFLDSRDLTEHGGTARASWLTDRGKQVLEIGPFGGTAEDRGE